MNALAPDAASQKAGAKLAAPGPWSETGYSPAERLLWGSCKGTGNKPYIVVLSVSDAGPAYQCSCPSRKFPCKHSLGLMLLWAAGAVADAEGVPGHVAEWANVRRERADKSAARRESRAAGVQADPAAAAKRAAQRQERITDGLADLERWLADQISAGLSDAESTSYAAVDPVARRLVDAQAPGVAARVRSLPALRAGGRDNWPDLLLAEFARLHLLCTAWTRLTELPEPLQRTVMRRVGISLDASAGERITDRWHVLGMGDRAMENLIERRIWLRGNITGRNAMLLSFGTAQYVPTQALPLGRVYAAEMTFFPEALPLRAQFEQTEPLRTADAAPEGTTLALAADSYAAALAVDPWTESWPVIIADAMPHPANGEGLLTDSDGHAVPLACSASALWTLLAVSGGAPVTVFGDYRETALEPFTVWADGRAVAL